MICVQFGMYLSVCNALIHILKEKCIAALFLRACVVRSEHPTIFLWLPDRTEDRSGLVGKIITFWQRIGSRVFECGGNDGFGGFLRLNSILEKNSKTSFRDRWDRSLQTERTGPLRYTLEHFVTLASQTYLCALVAACTPPHTMHKPHTHTQTLLPMSSWVFQRCMMGGMHH